jgi:murein L,D-transpeptidase YcbB/YkuD
VSVLACDVALGESTISDQFRPTARSDSGRADSVRTDNSRRGFFAGWFRSTRERDNAQADATDPEPEQEEYVPPPYEADPLRTLADADIDAPMPSDGLAASVLIQLRESVKPVLRVHASDREPILDVYAQRDFAPLWVGEFGLSTRGARLLALLSQAADEGLEPSEYLPGSLLEFTSQAAPSGSAFELARLDVELTVAALKYARHASVGRVVPSRLGRSIDLHPEAPAPAEVLARLVRTVRPDTYLASLHPTNAIYRSLRTELVQLHAQAGDEPDIIVPSGALLKAGQSDARVPFIQRKLHGLGLLADLEHAASDPGTLSDVYSVVLVAAVEAFQSRHGLNADGVVGPATTNAMNNDSLTRRLELVMLNMERARWLPRDLGERHVIVNQASYELRLYDQGAVIHQTRIIVGTPRNQTPMFSDEMETVVFNPYWNVPRSIATKEMLPQLRADPSYLDRQGFEIHGPNGRISSTSVHWSSYTARTMPYSFRQPPGASNALGYVKFLFPNQHSVYMHDTPTRNLFARDTRAFSHGCVRVQNAQVFAEIVLAAEGWTAERIAAAIATGRNQHIALQRKIPVHLTYFTAWADEHGLALYDDIYGRDAQLRRALGDNRLALK